MQTRLHLSPETKSALEQNQALVALESTVIAHGLPRPQSPETPGAVEGIVRAEGAAPATIAVLEGDLCVGLSEAQRRLIAHDTDVKKLSTRDIPIAVARGWNAATAMAISRVLSFFT